MKQDNRHYVYGSDNEITNRPEYPHIEKWITEGARVIDLGCGNGSLLSRVKENKNADISGIEVSDSGVNACLKKGVYAKAGRIDTELDDIDDDSFDFAVCNVTLQMVMYPEVTLREMKRIARYQIISFPNFAYFLNRLELLLNGRMPRRLLGGFNWYDTGHIHQFSIKDFRETISDLIGLAVKDMHYYGGLGRINFICPNMFAAGAIFLTEKLT